MRPTLVVVSGALLALGCGEGAASHQPSASSVAGTSAGGGAGAGAGGSGGATSSGGGSASSGSAGTSSGGGSMAGAAGSAGSGGVAGAATSDALADCSLAFPYRDEAPRGHWLGADSNFSVTLSATRALMTFQDSFVGSSQTGSRTGSPMVGNSVARIGCEAGKYAIDYHWGGTAQNHRALFDEPAADQHRLWIHRPWLYAGKLFLTATRVTSDAQGFVEGGTTLARVANPLEAPEAWSIEYFNLTDQQVTVGKGIAETEQYVYLFTPYQANMILARVAKDRLLEASISEVSLDYLKTDGSWGMGLVPASAKKLGLPANTGLTVRYSALAKRWLALFTNTSGWPSASIGVSSAEALEGPWSKVTEIYSVPEMNPQAPEFDADNICYGAAEHVAFNPEPDSQLLFTYTCNSSQLAKQLANMAIYVPRVVVVPHPLQP